MNSLGLSALVVSLVAAAPCPVSAQDVDAFLTRRMPYEAFDRLKATRVMISDTAFVYTGASASVKGYPQSAPFAMAKFALRGLVQSMARELVPQGIHVAHFVIDGAIRPPGQDEWTQRP
jgi:NAD(P)-dependent dehydrogenase (short-subunit alcohol dehydrogenase family)